MHSSLIYKDKIMLVMPVVSANFKPISNRQTFCAAPYAIGAEAEKVIRGMVNPPKVETRGLLTALLGFLKGDIFQAMTKDSNACLIRNITPSNPKIALCIQTSKGDIKIPTINSIKIDCDLSANSGEITSVTREIEKDSNACFDVNKFAQSDREAADELLKNVAVCK